ncbi:hypothetical protein TNCT_246851 [Trichonephila clavata]|uniref:Uncharacterized protein n=1 Tax=Trichonephila clavata TaxID=2740835 RepID=A0A8X6KPK0_TRICU|nr:hypothetical protein TNCT_246851 [Trichonephila clavata]
MSLGQKEKKRTSNSFFSPTPSRWWKILEITVLASPGNNAQKIARATIDPKGHLTHVMEHHPFSVSRFDLSFSSVIPPLKTRACVDRALRLLL